MLLYNVCRKKDNIAGVEAFTDDHFRDMGIIVAGLTEDDFRKLDKVSFHQWLTNYAKVVSSHNGYFIIQLDLVYKMGYVV